MRFYTCLSLLIFSASLFAQNRKIPVDTAISTNASTVINGQKITYKATTGMQPVFNGEDKTVATLHYTYYQRTNTGVKMDKRPLVISFNGGPGSASAWMHIAYTGPKLLNMDEEGFPTQPYGYSNNPHSILDVADILFVNPVNTGYSRIVEQGEDKVDRKQFFGINADINYLAEWISTFVSRNDRWLSPKFIIGESYGGTRVAGLAGALQERQWMYLNGVIMVSPADYKVFESDAPLTAATNLPYFAATAWYYKMLSAELQQKTLEQLLPEVEAFALNELMPAIAKGGFLEAKEKEAMIQQIAAYSGLSETCVKQNNLNVSTSVFWKELLRDKNGMTIGRLDSRYTGMDEVESGSKLDYYPELDAWLHSFTPAINHYFRTELGFQTDTKYNLFGDVHPWDRTNNHVRESLRKVMAQNPYLKVLVQSGYYDGATTYFHAKYSMMQTDPSGKMKDRFQYEAYPSGHMMYLRKEDLKKATDDLREFILNAIPEGAAKY